MFCVKCGASISDGSKFCTSCGERVAAGVSFEKTYKGQQKLSTRKKSILLILLSIVLTSVFWVFIYGSDIGSTEDEAVNIMVHLFETIGRQFNAWDRTGQMVDLVTYCFSDECLSSQECVDNTISSITTLGAEVEKEGEEIIKLWSQEVLGQDLDSYFSKLSEKNMNKILDVFNIYFPGEFEKLGPSEQLLLRR